MISPVEHRGTSKYRICHRPGCSVVTPNILLQKIKSIYWYLQIFSKCELCFQCQLKHLQQDPFAVWFFRNSGFCTWVISKELTPQLLQKEDLSCLVVATSNTGRSWVDPPSSQTPVPQIAHGDMGGAWNSVTWIHLERSGRWLLVSIRLSNQRSCFPQLRKGLQVFIHFFEHVWCIFLTLTERGWSQEVFRDSSHSFQCK